MIRLIVYLTLKKYIVYTKFLIIQGKKRQLRTNTFNWK